MTTHHQRHKGTRSRCFLTADGRRILWSPRDRACSYRSQSQLPLTSRRSGHGTLPNSLAWGKHETRDRHLISQNHEGNFSSASNEPGPPCPPETQKMKLGLRNRMFLSESRISWLEEAFQIIESNCFLREKDSPTLQTQALWLQRKPRIRSESSHS